MLISWRSKCVFLVLTQYLQDVEFHERWNLYAILYGHNDIILWPEHYYDHYVFELMLLVELHNIELCPEMYQLQPSEMLLGL